MICTTVQVPAVTGEQAVERAMMRTPAVGTAWEVKRTDAKIINVSRVEGGLSADDDHGDDKADIDPGP